MDDIHTLLCNSGLGHSYWAEAAAFSVETCNLIPSHRHPRKIPLELFSGKHQDISHLRTFGAKCWAKIPTVNGALVSGGSKLDSRGVECRFLGYASGNGNYKVQDLESRHVFVSWDVIFEEGQPHHTSPSVGENLPIFDTNLDVSLNNNGNPSDNDEPSKKSANHDNLNDDNLDPGDHPRDNMDNPLPTPNYTVEPHRSTRITKSSNSTIQSREYQQ